MPEWWLQLYEFVYSNADVAAAAAAVAPPPPPMMQIIIFFFWYCFRQDLKRHADDNGRWATSPGRLDGDGDVSATRRLGAALVGATVAAGMRPLR